MKKFIYILTVVSLVLALVAIPTFAEQDCNSKFHVLNLKTIDEKNQAVTSYVHEVYNINPNLYVTFNGYGLKQYFHITTLSDEGCIEIWQSLDESEVQWVPEKYTIITRKLYSNFGMTYDVTPSSYYFDGKNHMYIRVVDTDGNPIPFIVTYIKGDYDTAFSYIANEDENLTTLAHVMTSTNMNGTGSSDGLLVKPTLDPIECDSAYKLTLNAGDKCVITFNETLDSPRFKIYCDGQFPGGLTNAADMRTGYSYTFVAETAGDYYFDFYDTVTSKPGKFTIYRILADGSADYMQGFIDGMQQDGSYSEGYNAGKSDGYTEGYNQALKDNPDDGSYANGVAVGEANIFNQMREYMIAQGVDPASVPDSVEGLLEYYASSKNTNGGGSNNDGSYQEGYDIGYEEGYNECAKNLEIQYKNAIQSAYQRGLNEGAQVYKDTIYDEIGYEYNLTVPQAVKDDEESLVKWFGDTMLYKGQGMSFNESYNQAFDQIKDNIDNNTDKIIGSIDETANGSFIQGFLAGMWNGMTGFISMILTGITFSGLSLMHILSTAIAILSAAFVIKMLRG